MVCLLKSSPALSTRQLNFCKPTRIPASPITPAPWSWSVALPLLCPPQPPARLYSEHDPHRALPIILVCLGPLSFSVCPWLSAKSPRGWLAVRGRAWAERAGSWWAHGVTTGHRQELTASADAMGLMERRDQIPDLGGLAFRARGPVYP